MIVHISPDTVVAKAMSMIAGAHTSIYATELLSDNPPALPREYFELLQGKVLKEHISMKRIAFGTKPQFQRYTSVSFIDDPSFDCVLADSDQYQRMLMVDEREMLFGIDRGGLHLFFYTDETAVLEQFLRYFNVIFDKK